jgi:hypothetical protein
MANSTESLFWPLAFGFAFAFIILTFMIFSQASRSVTFHTSQEISHVVSNSYLHGFLGVRADDSEGTEMTNYRRISYNFCGKSRNIDKEIWNNARPQILKWVKIQALKPSACGGGTEQLLSKGSKGKDTRFKYDVKIPVRGGQSLTLRMRYEADGKFN